MNNSLAAGAGIGRGTNRGRGGIVRGGWCKVLHVVFLGRDDRRASETQGHPTGIVGGPRWTRIVVTTSGSVMAARTRMQPAQRGHIRWSSRRSAVAPVGTLAPADGAGP